jgi:hypothetical protein
MSNYVMNFPTDGSYEIINAQPGVFNQQSDPVFNRQPQYTSAEESDEESDDESDDGSVKLDPAVEARLVAAYRQITSRTPPFSSQGAMSSRRASQVTPSSPQRPSYPQITSQSPFSPVQGTSQSPFSPLEVSTNLPPPPPQSMYPRISPLGEPSPTLVNYMVQQGMPPPPPLSASSQGAMSSRRASQVAPASPQRLYPSLYPDVSDEQWAQQMASLLPPPPVVDWTEQVQDRLDTLRGRRVEPGTPTPRPSPSRRSSQQQIQSLPLSPSVESRRASQVAVNLPTPPTTTPQEQQRRPSVTSRATQVDIPFPSQSQSQSQSQQQYKGMPQGRPFTINVTTTPQMERFLASLESRLRRSPRRKSPRKKSAKKSSKGRKRSAKRKHN